MQRGIEPQRRFRRERRLVQDDRGG
jgi:hypothetical protein